MRPEFGKIKIVSIKEMGFDLSNDGAEPDYCEFALSLICNTDSKELLALTSTAY